MSFEIKYSILLKVSIHHLFFLNKGTVEFNSMSATEKSKQLELFDINDVFNIFPTSKTLDQLKGHHLVFKTQNDGFVIWAKVSGANDNIPFIDLENNLSLSFILQLKDSGFYNYTDLKMENAGKTYFLSNRRLSTESGSFPLINKLGDNNKTDETFILSDDGTTEENEKLTTEEKDNLIGIITVFMKADDSALDITDAQGKILTPHTEYEIQLNNRKTVWRYIFNSNQTVKNSDDVQLEGSDAKVLITKNEQPLTERGFISVELAGIELPNPDKGLSILNTSDNKYYSEIYM